MQPFRKMYVNDWIMSTRALTIAARGAYNDLQMFMWVAPVKGVLLGTLDDISRLITVQPVQAADILNELAKKGKFQITEDEGMIRIEDEGMIKQTKLGDTRREIGAKGAKARWEKYEPATVPEFEPSNPAAFVDPAYAQHLAITASLPPPDPPWKSAEFADTWKEWKDYSLSQHGKRYSIPAERHALEELSRLADFNEKEAIKILKYTMSKTWVHFRKPQDDESGKHNNNSNNGRDNGRRSTAKDLVSGSGGFFGS